MLFGNRTGQQSPKRSQPTLMSAFLGNFGTIIGIIVVLGAVYHFVGPHLLPSGNPLGDFGGSSGAGEHSLEKQAAAFARMKQTQAAELGTDILGMMDSCTEEAKRLDTFVVGLLTNAEGKRIAADPALVKRFRAQQNRERPPTRKDDRATIATFLGAVRACLANPSDMSLPNAGMVTELESMRSELQKQREALHVDRAQFEIIVAEAPRAPAAQTLQAALSQLDQTEKAALAQELEREVARVREEMNKKAIAAKVEEIRLIEQAKIDKSLAEKRVEADRIRTEAQVKEAKERADLERQRNEAFEAEAKEKKAGEAARARVEKERLQAKAADLKTKQTLAPFLAKTQWQPQLRDGKVRNEQNFSFGDRISFTRLKSVGALEPTNDGLGALATIGCYVPRIPHWQFEPIPATWSKGTTAMVQEAQDLLRELGPTLVEMKLLNP